LKVLVAYASKYGSTKRIAEFIGEKLRNSEMNVDVKDVISTGDLAGYDAFVVGSALFMGHWMKEAKGFLSKNRAVLTSKPTWIFSSGPTGTKSTDKKGRDLLEVSGPTELDELRSWVHPREHKVFFGAFFADRLKGTAALFARMIPKDEEGDFRNWPVIESWASSIAQELATEKQIGGKS